MKKSAGILMIAVLVTIPVLSTINHLVREAEFFRLVDQACTADARTLAKNIRPSMDLNRSGTDEGSTLLQRSVECGNESTMRWLIEHGADPTKEGDNGPLIESAPTDRIRNLLSRAIQDRELGNHSAWN